MFASGSDIQIKSYAQLLLWNSDSATVTCMICLAKIYSERALFCCTKGYSNRKSSDYSSVIFISRGDPLFQKEISSAWLCQKSSWNRNSSVVRPSVASSISEVIAWISFKFLNYLRIFFVFVNMGPNGSENFETLLLLQINSQTFWNLSWISLAVVLTKVLFWIFEILSFWFSFFPIY